MYLDANNLYGWAMSQPLPVSDFRWVEEIDESLVRGILETSAESEEGYIVECDLDYPADTHDHHNDYPLAPERKKVAKEMISGYSKELLEQLKLKHHPCEKLVPNLASKTNYILHYRNLQLYVRLGLKIVKVHRVLKFSQRAWLEEYITSNTNRRSKAKDTHEKDLFKLMNNAIFGKTMENKELRKFIKLATSEKTTLKEVAKPSFTGFKIFSPDLVAIQKKQINILLDKPMSVGMSILELSKLWMYQFWFDVLKPKYGENINLLFTDTDSLCFEVATENIYKDMLGFQDQLDTSDFPAEHFLHSDQNKKVIGKFKDEMNGDPIQEFVGLRPKMYSILSEKGEKFTAKGISKAAQKHLRHRKYREALFDRSVLNRVKMQRIQSMKHQLHTLEINKIGLNPADDKRYLLDDGITTLAYGNYKIDFEDLMDIDDSEEW